MKNLTFSKLLFGFMILLFLSTTKTSAQNTIHQVSFGTEERQKLLEDWVDFYAENYGWKVNFDNIQIPLKPETGKSYDKWKLIIVAETMTPQTAFDACRPLFNAHHHYPESLDNDVVKNARTAKNGSYAIWVHESSEPDSVTLGQSGNIADPDMHGITLSERILFEQKYFTETEKHLDIRGLTFCSGSRDTNGWIPAAEWVGTVFKIYWYNQNRSLTTSGSRSVFY